VAQQIPMVDYLVLGDEPHLVANKCESCGSLFFDRRNACASCGGRSFTRVDVPPTGKVRSFTIVHRAAPGVPAPFVSAVIDLDGGGKVKANIVGVEPAPEKITLGMPVKLATFVAGTDSKGTEAVAFGFAPA
jgi:uncharacterized OB-fold protein